MVDASMGCHYKSFQNIFFSNYIHLNMKREVKQVLMQQTVELILTCHRIIIQLIQLSVRNCLSCQVVKFRPNI